MSKGRPRKAGERYPSGKLKPEYGSPTLVRRMLDRAKKAASDPLLGSEIGRLRLAGVITDRHVSAANRFAEIVGTHDRIQGFPRRAAASPSYGSGYSRGRISDVEQDEMISLMKRCGSLKEAARESDLARTILTVRSQYQAALDALVGCGNSVRRVIVSVVVDDRTIAAGEQRLLLSGLDALADSWNG